MRRHLLWRIALLLLPIHNLTFAHLNSDSIHRCRQNEQIRYTNIPCEKNEIEEKLVYTSPTAKEIIEARARENKTRERANNLFNARRQSQLEFEQMQIIEARHALKKREMCEQMRGKIEAFRQGSKRNLKTGIKARFEKLDRLEKEYELLCK